MIDFQSIIIYFGLAVISFFIAKYAELAKSRKAVWLCVLLMAIVAGFRAKTVGIDTKTYVNTFDLITFDKINLIYGIEKSFIYICAGLLSVWENNQFLLFIFAFISHGLIIFRIWKDRKHISFSYGIISYYILFFPFSLNGLRQFIAASIVFFATSFIREGKYWKFAIAIIIASLFHLSAIIGLAYLIFELIFLKYFNLKRKLYVFLFVGIGGIIGISFVGELLSKYLGYFEHRATSVGIMMIFKLLLLICSFVIFAKVLNKDERYYYSSWRWYYFMGLLLNSLSYVFLYMGRIGLYFYLFETIFIGYLFKQKNRTRGIVLFKFVYLALLMYYLYLNLVSGAQGELPYRFFWQI